MAGTINFAMTQQFDMDGRPLSGGLLYFYVAGTTTPQNAFQDIALTIAWPNPIVLDASGRVPMFYLADGLIKIRLTTEGGVTVIAEDQLLVIGPSTGGVVPTPVDPTTVMATGDIKVRYGEGTLTGFVRCNGRTIGNSTSGATELADTSGAQALFEYLWSFTNIALDGVSKGATANADFVAGRRMFLPDLRGRAIVGTDDMGASAAGRLTQALWGAGSVSPIVLGSASGSQSRTPVLSDLFGHTHSDAGHQHAVSGSTATQSGAVNHVHPLPDINVAVVGTTLSVGVTNVVTGVSYGSYGAVNTDVQNQAHVHLMSFTSGSGNASLTSTGGSQPYPVADPGMVLTYYIKL